MASACAISVTEIPHASIARASRAFDRILTIAIPHGFVMTTGGYVTVETWAARRAGKEAGAV